MMLEEWTSEAEERAAERTINATSDLAAFKFALAPQAPRTFISDAKAASESAKRFLSFKRGTTTLAFRFQGGIMVACDSRASMGK